MISQNNTVESMLQEWDIDAKIDPTAINIELIKSPELHSKYLKYFIKFRAEFSSLEREYSTLSWKKRKYFRGEMEKVELLQNGWSQWNGLKPSAAELNQLLDMDSDLAGLKEKITNAKAAVSASEFILRKIEYRDQSIKTLFEYNKYVSG